MSGETLPPLPEGYRFVTVEVFGGPMLGVETPHENTMTNGSYESLAARAWARHKQGRPNGMYWVQMGVLDDWEPVTLNDGEVLTKYGQRGEMSLVRVWGDALVVPGTHEYEGLVRDHRAMEAARAMLRGIAIGDEYDIEVTRGENGKRSSAGIVRGSPWRGHAPGGGVMEIAKGGLCPSRRSALNQDLERHSSTSGDIDASRMVPVHICDYCRGLFVPASTPQEEEGG